eukprot:Opistho-2@63509
MRVHVLHFCIDGVIFGTTARCVTEPSPNVPLNLNGRRSDRYDILTMLLLAGITTTQQAESRHGIKLTWAPEVLDVVIRGYNVHYGARSIRNEVSVRQSVTCPVDPIAKYARWT